MVKPFQPPIEESEVDATKSCPKPKFPCKPHSPDAQKNVIPINNDKHPIIYCDKQKTNTTNEKEISFGK